MQLQTDRPAATPLYIRLREEDNVAIVANQGGLQPAPSLPAA